jgi:hypothetical protein
MSVTPVKLSDVIMQLKSELELARKKGEGHETLSVREVTVTTKFVVKASGEGGITFDFYVLSGDAGATIEGQHSHEMTVKLSPITGRDIDLGEED